MRAYSWIALAVVALACSGSAFTASEQGNKLTGSFKAGDNTFDFTATMQGDTMTFQTGTTTYNLKRQAAKPVNPLE